MAATKNINAEKIQGVLDPSNVPNYLGNIIEVNTANWATTLGGTIDSTKKYYIDGFVDPQGVSIDLSGGKVLNIGGGGTNVSKIISTANNYTMITGSDVGEIMFDSVTITIGGTNSKLGLCTANTGFEAISFITVNFDDCTSLGEFTGFNQGLEIITRRFGGTPQMTLSGAWSSGYFIDTSIVRNLTGGSYSLFKAGSGFLMTSRFRSNQNIDLPTGASFLDFSPSNFVNPSTLDLDGCRITRNGASDATDLNITPNISESDLASVWRDNQGVPNTFVGGKNTLSTKISTPITQGVFTDLLGTWTPTGLVHFDSPANGQLRHLGDNPIEFTLIIGLALDGTSNDVVRVKVVAWRDKTSSFDDVVIQERVVNNFAGSRNIAFFTIFTDVILNQNDYIKLQVTDDDGNNAVELELDSTVIIQQR